MTWAEIPSCLYFQPATSGLTSLADEPRRSHYQLSGKDRTILVQGCIDRQPFFSFSYLPVLLLPYEIILILGVDSLYGDLRLFVSG